MAYCITHDFFVLNCEDYFIRVPGSHTHSAVNKNLVLKIVIVLLLLIFSLIVLLKYRMFLFVNFRNSLTQVFLLGIKNINFVKFLRECV